MLSFLKYSGMAVPCINRIGVRLWKVNEKEKVPQEGPVPAGHNTKTICNYIIAQKWLRINRKSLRSRVAYDMERRKRWCLMKEIVVVTRITIGGQQYTAEELGEEKAKEIVRQRVEAAVESMGYERSKE